MIAIPSYILQGATTEEVQQNLYRVLRSIANAYNALEAVVKAHDDVLKAQIESKSPSPPIAPNTQITFNDMTAIQQALSASGTHTLNVQNLPGTLLNVQPAAIPTVPSLPPITTAEPNTIVFQGGKIQQANYSNPSSPQWSLLT